MCFLAFFLGRTKLYKEKQQVHFLCDPYTRNPTHRLTSSPLAMLSTGSTHQLVSLARRVEPLQLLNFAKSGYGRGMSACTLSRSACRGACRGACRSACRSACRGAGRNASRTSASRIGSSLGFSRGSARFSSSSSSSGSGPGGDSADGSVAKEAGPGLLGAIVSPQNQRYLFAAGSVLGTLGVAKVAMNFTSFFTHLTRAATPTLVATA